MIKFRECLGEFIGTAFLLMAVVGSGIMGERLAGGNAAVALLANSLATGVVLAGLITVLGPVSGAHFNPVVTLMMAFWGEFPLKRVFGYVWCQVAGALMGVAAAHMMFGIPAWEYSNHDRSGSPLIFSEMIATLGLIFVIMSCRGKSAAPLIIAGYIVGAYWFTSSTCFANPAVTIARAFTDTFSGISLKSVPGFIAGQLIGAVCGFVIARMLGTDRGSIEEGK